MRNPDAIGYWMPPTPEDEPEPEFIAEAMAVCAVCGEDENQRIVSDSCPRDGLVLAECYACGERWKAPREEFRRWRCI